MITLIPKTRSQARREPSRGAAEQPAPAANASVRSALEPVGNGAYVEAVREWIERITPRSLQRAPLLRLVR